MKKLLFLMFFSMPLYAGDMYRNDPHFPKFDANMDGKLDEVATLRSDVEVSSAASWNVINAGAPDSTARASAAAVALSTGNVRNIAVMSQDVAVSVSSNIFANVTGLSFAVVSGNTYRFYALITYTSAATSTGSKWSISVPATTYLGYRSIYTLTATTLTSNFLSAGDLPAACNATSVATGNIAEISGIIIPSANGTVQVRFATEIKDSAITAKAGSILEWW